MVMEKASRFLLTTVCLAAVLFSGCMGSGGGKEFGGLVSAANGAFLVDEDPELRIESICFYDYDNHEISISIIDNPGGQIKAIALRKRMDVKEFDIPRTLAADAIDFGLLPDVPQEIVVEVSDSSPKGEVELYILTDNAYPTPSYTSMPGLKSKQLKFKARIGLKGIQRYIAIEEDGIHLVAGDGGQVSIGEGPMAILIAVRKKGGRLEARSQPVIVKRKGIVHPDDRWLDEYKSGYFSRPFFGDKFESSRVAFFSRVNGMFPKVIISTFDFKYHYDVSNLFPEGPVSIDHWGRTEDDYDVLYVRGEFGLNELHKVKVGQADVMRMTGSHADSLESATSEEKKQEDIVPEEDVPVDEAEENIEAEAE